MRPKPEHQNHNKIKFKLLEIYTFQHKQHPAHPLTVPAVTNSKVMALI